ncbi:hypothetical protein [Falsiroseomonas sp. E2-1-a20]|uniref:hypothetical protein n=1 Tax=Falsiroseomonas sp. E2-1-a20 TaxID=3239300 RepID=UPI003F3B09A9
MPEQVERLAMMVLLLLFGGALVGGLLAPLRWVDVGVALAVLLVAGLLGLVGLRAAWHAKATLAFFGIRGVGSFYYLAYGLNHSEFAEAERLWGPSG